MNQKKKHHFIAQTYLREFCNSNEKVLVYSKDRPTKPWWSSTESVAFENYYYSQPLLDGGQNNNSLEDFFSDIESKWPEIVSKICAKERYEGGLDQLVLFAVMHRVRVPSARDAVEKMLAESVRMTAKHLHARGELPPAPKKLSAETLIQDMLISIDPHRSIHAMTTLAKGMAQVIDAIGFRIIENRTAEVFITSDNPVVYFDPNASMRLLRPYNVGASIEFMFPITPQFMLWGHSRLKPLPGMPQITEYQTLNDRSFVRRANVLIARFAHRMVFASKTGFEPLVKKYANLSPIASVVHLEAPQGRGLLARYEFGKRDVKPKWTRS